MVSRQIIIFALTFSLTSNLAEELPDRCTRFEGHLYNSTLVECPPAKFMIKDELFECYDKTYKDTLTSKSKLFVSTPFFLC